MKFSNFSAEYSYKKIQNTLQLQYITLQLQKLQYKYITVTKN